MRLLQNYLYQYCLASAFVCFALQVLTGILLSLQYEPSLRPASTEAGKPLVMVEITKQLRFKPTQTSFSKGERYFLEWDTASKAPFYAPDTLRTVSRLVIDTRSTLPLQATTAYLSVEQGIMRSSDFGSIIRGVHQTAASLSIIVLVCWMLFHLFHGIAAQGLLFPHIFPHIAGTLLFALTFGTSIIGYILPMNLQSLAALEILLASLESFPLIGVPLANLLKGSSALGSTTIVRLYILHILLIPALLGVCWYLARTIVLWDKERRLQYAILGVSIVWLCVGITCGTALPTQDSMSLPADFTKVFRINPHAQPEWYALGFAALLKILPSWSVSIGAVLWLSVVVVLPLIERFSQPVGNVCRSLAALFLLGFILLTFWELRHYAFPQFGFTEESLETVLVMSILSATLIGTAIAYKRQSEG